MSEDLQAFYARNRERGDRSAQEWAARQPDGAFALGAEAAAWADREVAGSSVATLPIVRTTAGAWAEWLEQPRTYIGSVVSELARRAASAGVLLVPEPGIVGIAFASRHPETEEETALGWGFCPHDAEALVLHATRAQPIDELAGKPGVTGADALVGVLRGAVDALNDLRVGPVPSRDLMRKAAGL